MLPFSIKVAIKIIWLLNVMVGLLSDSFWHILPLRFHRSLTHPLLLAIL